MRARVLAAAAVSITLVTIVLAGCGTSTVPGSAYGTAATASAMSSTTPSASAHPATARRSASGGSSAVLTVRKTPIGYVLADAHGYTIYWDANDPKGGSRPACIGSCLQVWFPVTGRPVAATGLRLRAVLGRITRPSGLVQATYNGYPLYTFARDTAPGMANGSGGSAGLWHVINEKPPTNSPVS